jgi:hypothetical protein
MHVLKSVLNCAEHFSYLGPDYPTSELTVTGLERLLQQLEHTSSSWPCYDAELLGAVSGYIDLVTVVIRNA